MEDSRTIQNDNYLDVLSEVFVDNALRRSHLLLARRVPRHLQLVQVARLAPLERVAVPGSKKIERGEVVFSRQERNLTCSG